MNSSWYRKRLSVVLICFLYLPVTGQDLIKNGDFEYPLTDGLLMPVQNQEMIPGWDIDAPVSVINHTRLFPYSNFQSLLLSYREDQRTGIRQEIFVDRKGSLEISFSLAASRMEEGTLIVLLDNEIVQAYQYGDFWKPSETVLTDHMKWKRLELHRIAVEPGSHQLELRTENCTFIKDHQGDSRDMVEGFLVDNVKAEFKPWLNNTGIPCLDELAGQWTDARTLACYPTIGNFKGSVKVSKSFGGVDTEFFTGTKLPGTTGMFKSGETVIFNDQVRWFPYQVITRASFNGVELTATLRLVFEGSSLLMKVEIANPTEHYTAFPLAMTLVPGILNASTDRDQSGPVILYKDTYFAYSFLDVPDKINTTSDEMEATWDLHLSPGETRDISYVMSIGNNYDAAITEAGKLIRLFQGAFIEAKNAWSARWNAVFTPGNEHYSGALPVFETSDRNLYELYYLSVASFLQNQQNNVYPTMPKAFGSNNEWARNQAYFWEISQVADIYALLDPAGLRQLLRMCLSVDINKGNAIDYSNGAIVNHWYAVNDYAVFKTIDAYVRINRDFDFLTEEVAGKTVRDHMFSLATAWEERYNRLYGLADYGSEPWSFFETNPDYIHMVPAMNAQDVWMMRSMAKYETLYGSELKANVLLEKADQLASNVKDLYVPGEGVWKIKYPDGSTIVSRHSYDFLTIGTTMNNDLDPRMKEEMLRFVEDELLEANYMRAMSLKDQAALNSDRSDHGPAGSYIGWPALTVQAMADMGALCKASETLGDFRLAFVEAGMGQAIEFLMPVGSTSVITRTGARAGASFLLSAANYANTIIDGLMGYDPGIDGSIEPSLPGKPRCFDGRLSHLRHGNDLYTIFAHSGGIKMLNENRKD